MATSILTLALLVITLGVNGLVRADDMACTGVFTGLSNHVTTGSVSGIKGADGVQIVLGADFAFDGAPDPKVALGKNGKYAPATLISPLKSDTGEQSYNVPGSIKVDEYNEVYIWCENFR